MNIDDAFQHVADNLVPQHIYFLSVALRLGNNTAEEVMYDYEHNIREAIYQLLKKWKQRNGNKATLRVLAAALWKIRYSALAQEICPDYSPPHRTTINNETVQPDAVPIEPYTSSSGCSSSQGACAEESESELPRDLEDAMLIVQEKFPPGDIRRLSSALGLGDEIAEEILNDFKNKGRLCLYKLMITWIRRQVKNANIPALAIAVSTAGQFEIAQRIYPDIPPLPNVPDLELESIPTQSRTDELIQNTGARQRVPKARAIDNEHTKTQDLSGYQAQVTAQKNSRPNITQTTAHDNAKVKHSVTQITVHENARVENITVHTTAGKTS